MNSPRLALRTTQWKPSETLAVMAEASRRRALGRDVVDFGPGEPDFVTPAPICEAARRAIDEGFTHYTPTGGIPELRAAIAELYTSNTGTPYEPNQVIVGCGGKHLLWEVFHALFQEGDEVLLPAPYWTSFPEQIAMSSAAPYFVPAGPETGFVPSPESLREACNERTRGIVVNTPTNPTGAVWPAEVMHAIGDLALEKNLWIILDETYDKFLYDGAEHVSLAARQDLASRLVAINSFSKTYAMTGWRVGYCVAPQAVATPVQRLQSQLTSGANSVAQRAAFAAIVDEGGAVSAEVQKMLEAFTSRRTLALEKLEQVPGLHCRTPMGAFYLFPDVRESLERLGIEDDMALAKHLLEECDVAVVPGQAFGAPGFIRLSFALGSEEIVKGLDRIAETLGGG